MKWTSRQASDLKLGVRVLWGAHKNMINSKKIYISLGVILVAFLAVFVFVQNNNKVLLSSISDIVDFEIIQLDREKIQGQVASTTSSQEQAQGQVANATSVQEQVKGQVANTTSVQEKAEEQVASATSVQEQAKDQVASATSVQARIEEKAEEVKQKTEEVLEKAQEQKELVASVEPKEKVAVVDDGIDKTIDAMSKQKEAINSVNDSDDQKRKEAFDIIEQVGKEVNDLLVNQQKNILLVKDEANKPSMDKVENINNEIMQIVSGQQSMIDAMFGFEKEREVMDRVLSLATELYQGDLRDETAMEKYINFYDSYNQAVADYYESPEMKESLTMAREQIYETIRESSITKEEIETIERIQDPRSEGPILKDIFNIQELVVQEKRYREDGVEDIGKLAISGFGPPSSLIFLFLYSTPIMVHTETDNNGEWRYVLEVELEDGSHEMYVASVDRTGNIIARSDAVPFIKEAAAVQLDFMPISMVGAQSIEFFDRKNVTAISLVFLFILIVTIILTGMSVSKKQYFQE